MDARVEKYLIDGCGRCAFGGTPACKVNNWRDELKLLRAIALACGLDEDLKWSVPCYTYKGKNILIVAAFKEYAALSFFKGALLKDEGGLLHKPGDSSQSTRMFRCTDARQIQSIEPLIKAYICEAMEVEKLGMKIETGNLKEPMPEELIAIFQSDPKFKAEFEALTPGRQRGYILHFNQAKQSKTRIARIEKYKEKIMSGKGLMD